MDNCQHLERATADVVWDKEARLGGPPIACALPAWCVRIGGTVCLTCRVHHRPQHFCSLSTQMMVVVWAARWAKRMDALTLAAKSSIRAGAWFRMKRRCLTSSLATYAAVLQDTGSGDCTSYSIVVTPPVVGLMCHDPRTCSRHKLFEHLTSIISSPYNRFGKRKCCATLGSRFTTDSGSRLNWDCEQHNQIKPKKPTSVHGLEFRVLLG